MKKITISLSELLLLGGYNKFKVVDKAVDTVTARQIELEQDEKAITTIKANRKRLRCGTLTTQTAGEEVVKKALRVVDNSNEKSVDIFNSIKEESLPQAPISHTFQRELELPGVTRRLVVTCRKLAFTDDRDMIVVKKTRAYKLWKRVWPSDLANLHVRMFLTRTNLSRFEESTKRETEVYKTNVHWNSDRWRDVIQRLTIAIIRIEDNMKQI